ncbi:MAG: VWA domain-containing protein [Leptospiraceae bacterium]|nr:VWA domain-containing protein [Leptospiraceae bacterium]
MNHFDRPYILYLIPFVGLMIFIYYKFKIYELKNSFFLATQSNTETSYSKTINFLLKVFPFLRFVSIVLIIIALAGPGSSYNFLPDEKEGVDIMLAIDVSGSMTESMDFLPSNRLEVSKELLLEFVEKRIKDRMGIVVFSGAAYLQAPLTGDPESIKEIIKDVNKNSVVEQGTAIGDAIILATYRLKKSKAKSRIILLFTDGVSNMGKIDMKTSAETSKEFGVKIYTIGIGKDLDSQTDFMSLKEISDITGGKFYRALDEDQLEDTLNDIDRLERDKLEAPPQIIIEPYFHNFLYPAIIILMFDLIIRAFIWKFFI